MANEWISWLFLKQVPCHGYSEVLLEPKEREQTEMDIFDNTQVTFLRDIRNKRPLLFFILFSFYKQHTHNQQRYMHTMPLMMNLSAETQSKKREQSSLLKIYDNRFWFIREDKTHITNE